jgi:hypothetical protein
MDLQNVPSRPITRKPARSVGEENLVKSHRADRAVSQNVDQSAAPAYSLNKNRSDHSSNLLSLAPMYDMEFISRGFEILCSKSRRIFWIIGCTAKHIQINSLGRIGKMC